MLIINVEKCGSFDKALKKYKKKFQSTKIGEELRERKTFTKLSQRRKEEKEKATFRNKWSHKYNG